MQPLSDEARFSRFAAAGRSVEAVVVFDQKRPEGAVKSVLSAAGVKPYAVYMFLEGMTGIHRVAAAEANLAVVDQAREVSLRQTGDAVISSQATIAALAARPADGPGLDERYAKHALISDDQSRAMRRGLQNGQPIIYAVAIVGTPDRVRALSGSPNVSSVSLGTLLENGRVALPRVEPPTDAIGRFQSGRAGQLVGRALKEELQLRAQSGGGQ
jgi:hypothetical protein